MNKEIIEKQINDMNVVVYADNADTVIKRLRSSLHVGLRHINSKEHMFVTLTTFDEILVLCKERPSHVELLRKVVNDSQIRIFTQDGMTDSYFLKHWGATLREPHIDLIAFDIFLQIQLGLDKNESNLNQYSISAIHKHIRPKRSNYANLLKKYVCGDLELTAIDLESADFTLMNLEAETYVRNYSGLIPVLAQSMTRRYAKIYNQPSKNIYAAGIQSLDDASTYEQMCMQLNRPPTG